MLADAAQLGALLVAVQTEDAVEVAAVGLEFDPMEPMEPAATEHQGIDLVPPAVGILELDVRPDPEWGTSGRNSRRRRRPSRSCSYADRVTSTQR